MTERPGVSIFSSLRWPLAAAAAISLLSGCATSTIEDAAPAAAVEAPMAAPTAAGVATTVPPSETPAVTLAEDPVGADPSQVASSTGQPINSGTFPNLNIPPQSAAKQITAAEKAAKLAELKAARTAQTAPRGATGSPAAKARMKKLAATHASEALEEIENN